MYTDRCMDNAARARETSKSSENGSQFDVVYGEAAVAAAAITVDLTQCTICCGILVHKPNTGTRPMGAK